MLFNTKGELSMKKVRNHIFLSSVLILFIAMPIVSGISLSISNEGFIVAQEIDWLDGWSHRKSHTIAGSAGAGSKYQMSPAF